MTQGTLTLRTDDGYVIEAPVEGFSVDVGDDYSARGVDYLLDTGHIYLEPQTVVFSATLKYGENYTVRDLGVEIERTLVVKDIDQKHLSLTALGVPADATARYNPKKEQTRYTWTERVIRND